ncbi:MAG: hypothetical protein K8T20_16510 [Planctomycetes bacterium]|nr:hypothetical protein [Planctomycetota bacterium]
MLVTAEGNGRNRWHSAVLAGGGAMAVAAAGWFYFPALLLLAFVPVVYWMGRRRCVRRMSVMARPFPASWEVVLQRGDFAVRLSGQHGRSRRRR